MVTVRGLQPLTKRSKLCLLRTVRPKALPKEGPKAPC